MRILLVEDDPRIARKSPAVLEDAGMRSIRSRDGEDSLVPGRHGRLRPRRPRSRTAEDGRPRRAQKMARGQAAISRC